MQFTREFHTLTSNSTNVNINTYNNQHLLSSSCGPDSMLHTPHAVFVLVCGSDRSKTSVCVRTHWHNLFGKGRMGAGSKGVFA